MRRLTLSGVHAMLAAYFAVMAQQWLSVSSGRAGTLTLLTPANDVFGRTWAAAIAGALLGPVLHIAVGRAIHDSKGQLLIASAWGMGYACAVMWATITIAMPWMMVAGRGPGESVSAALANAACLLVIGTPLLVITSTLLFAPILLGGGATIGIAAMVVERRALRASATSQPCAR